MILTLRAPLVLLLTLTACAPVKVRMGWRTPLNQTPISSIHAALPKGAAIAPGEKSPLVVSITEPNGQVLQTEGKGHGKILWRDLKLDTTLVTANQKGDLTLSPDPRDSEGQQAHVTVTVPSHPDLRADLDIPLRYDYPYTANFSGSSGSSGSDGFNGTDGTSGMSGSLDPNHPSAGSDGGNGSNGSDGSRGGDGGDAPPVLVRVTLKPGPHPLLQIAVIPQIPTGKYPWSKPATPQEMFFLVDPQEGSLTVIASGGSGGRGGKGGRGGRGGSGGIGSPEGSSGSNGSDGHDGSSGFYGHSGQITVVYDSSAQSYLSAIHLPARYPEPLFTEQPVPPLW